MAECAAEPRLISPVARRPADLELGTAPPAPPGSPPPSLSPLAPARLLSNNDREAPAAGPPASPSLKRRRVEAVTVSPSRGSGWRPLQRLCQAPPASWRAAAGGEAPSLPLGTPPLAEAGVAQQSSGSCAVGPGPVATHPLPACSGAARCDQAAWRCCACLLGRRLGVCSYRPPTVSLLPCPPTTCSVVAGGPRARPTGAMRHACLSRALASLMAHLPPADAAALAAAKQFLSNF